MSSEQIRFCTVPGSLWKPTSRWVKGQPAWHLTHSSSEAQDALAGHPVYGSHQLRPLGVAQHLPASEEKPWNQACRTVLKGSKSRDKTQNLETGKETSSAASLEMERLDVLQAFLDYGL